ncbi:unnamed protein product [Oppiella nova]|uniref:Uncharacterized protein n=1 Tax=Oppiella nova TaxID=334625 RepID=A0A7R9MSI2_9ACAR|nr:unnamed protein product [Oppiella nova]CAG2182738.1 unnamed protein product [Oppiella nova]
MKKLVNQFVKGIEYKLVKDEFESDLGSVRVPFGRLDMSDQHLHQNLTFLLSTIEKHKPSTSIVPFITRVLIQSEPSKEEFALKFWDYVDGYEARNAEAVDDEADDKGDDKALTSL